MALPTLDTLEDALFTQSTALLGDPITYDGGAGPVAIRAFVNHEDMTDSYGGMQVTAQDITVEVDKDDVDEPAYSDIITLPKLGNAQFNPKDWKNHESGKTWVIMVQKVV